MLIGLWVVVVLAGCALVADLTARAVAQRTVGRALARSEHLAAPPTIMIHRLPFLPQLARGHYPLVTATASGVRVRGLRQTVTLDRVDATLTGVRTTRDLRELRAESCTAIATLSHPALRALGVVSALPAPVAASAVRAALGVGLSWAGVPFEVRVQALRSAPGGVVLELHGSDLHARR